MNLSARSEELLSKLRNVTATLNGLQESILPIQEGTKRLQHGINNRVAVEESLNELIETLQIPQVTISILQRRPLDITIDLIEHAVAVDRITKRAKVSRKKGEAMKAAQETIVKGESLLKNVCLAADTYFTIKLKGLAIVQSGGSLGSLQMLQRVQLLPFMELYRLLSEHDQESATSFYEQYVTSASQWYQAKLEEGIVRFKIDAIAPLTASPLIGDNLWPGAHRRGSSKSAIVKVWSDWFHSKDKSNAEPEEPNNSKLAASIAALWSMFWDSMVKPELTFAQVFFRRTEIKSQRSYLKDIFGGVLVVLERKLSDKLQTMLNLQELLETYNVFDEKEAIGPVLQEVLAVFEALVEERLRAAFSQQGHSLQMATIALNQAESNKSVKGMNQLTSKFGNFLKSLLERERSHSEHYKTVWMLRERYNAFKRFNGLGSV